MAWSQPGPVRLVPADKGGSPFAPMPLLSFDDGYYNPRPPQMQQAVQQPTCTCSRHAPSTPATSSPPTVHYVPYPMYMPSAAPPVAQATSSPVSPDDPWLHLLLRYMATMADGAYDRGRRDGADQVVVILWILLAVVIVLSLALVYCIVRRRP
jgi:hypothetical protein